MTFNDLTVDWDFFSGTHSQKVTWFDRFDGDIALGLCMGINEPGHFGLQSDQVLNGCARFTARAGLKHSAKQNQRHNDSGRLKVHVVSCLRNQRRGQKHHHGIKPGAASTHGHERIHLGLSPKQGFKPMGEEMLSWPGEHERGQCRLYPMLRGNGHDTVEPMTKCRHHVRAHFHHKDRQGQERSRPELFLQLPDFILGLGLNGLGGCVCFQYLGAKARFLNGGNQLWF